MPRHSGEWLSQLEAFRDLCSASDPWEDTDRIREAALLKGKASGDENWQPTAINDRLLEHLIAQGAYECAALEVIGDQADFDLAGGLFGACSARVRLPGQALASTGEGSSMTIALLAAWAKAQLAVVDHSI